MAIIARCRMPPDSSCGYCSARRSGKGMATRFSISTARAAALFAETAVSWIRIASAICAPIVSTGLSAVIGS
jgi:hypothetical protein